MITNRKLGMFVKNNISKTWINTIYKVTDKIRTLY